MSTLFPTRSEQIGIKPRVLAARTRKSLGSIRERIEELSRPWVEIDNSIEGARDELVAQFDEFARSIEESIRWLEEEAPR